MTYTANDFRVVEVDTDVVVVGAGAGGGMAAIAARKAGARVALVDKAGIYRSGCGAAGEDHFVAVLEMGEEWDTPKAFGEWYHKLTQGFCNPAIIDNGFLPHIQGLVRHMEDLGVKMRLDTKNNAYIRTGSYAAPGKYWINYDGRDMPPKVAEEARQAGVDFFYRTPVTDVLTKDGQVAGVVAVEFRTGTAYHFKTKTAVLCTGNVCRMYDNLSGEPFNVWNSPYNTGVGHKVAFDAGAKVANMEFIGFNITPKNFGTPGLAGLTGMGAYIVNGKGERIVFKYHPMGEKGPRWALCEAVYWETKEGRGPIYVDARHLAPADMDHLLTHLLPVDKKSFGDYLDQKGIDLHKDLMEVEVTGGEIPAMAGQVSGIFVDAKHASTLPGLYAAGGNALAMGSVSGSMCGGITAGRAAAEYAAGLKHLPEVDRSTLDEVTARAFAPLAPKPDGISYREFEDKLRQIMSRYVGIGRTADGLKGAIRNLDFLESLLPRLAASDGHDLMRCLEARELLAVSQMIARGALIREESRFGLSHFRGDYPEPRDEWHKLILQQKTNGGVDITYQAPYDL